MVSRLKATDNFCKIGPTLICSYNCHNPLLGTFKRNRQFLQQFWIGVFKMAFLSGSLASYVLMFASISECCTENWITTLDNFCSFCFGSSFKTAQISFGQMVLALKCILIFKGDLVSNFSDQTLVWGYRLVSGSYTLAIVIFGIVHTIFNIGPRASIILKFMTGSFEPT